MNGGVVGISISMSMNPGRVVCGCIAAAVVPITGTCVPVPTDEAWAAMVGGSAVQVDPSTFTEMGKWIGGMGWPIHTFAEMVGGSVSVDSSTFSEVVAESAVDTFAIDRRLHLLKHGPSVRLGAPHQEHVQMWMAPERLILLDLFYPRFAMKQCTV